MPQLSVIIPVHNGQRTLAECLQSIPPQLDLEIIVVDDGSSDASLDIARQFGAVCLPSVGPPQGPAAARNRGLLASRAPLVAFLDADDWWPVGSLQARLQVLQEQPGCAVVQGLIETRQQGVLSPAIAQRRLPGPRYNVNLGACLFRRQTLDQIGVFAEDLRFGEDSDLFMRLWEEQVAKQFLPITCLYYRLHQSNMCGQAPDPVRTRLGLFRRHKDRLKGRDFEPPVAMADYMGWTQTPS